MLLTQCELPEKPESGSSGSSTTQPLQVTSERTAKALLGSVLMYCIDRLASRAYKAGQRPVLICRLLLHRPWDERAEEPLQGLPK